MKTKANEETYAEKNYESEVVDLPEQSGYSHV